MKEGPSPLDWSDILKEHGSALVLYARQWTGNHADAEEAVQNGFLKFWRSPQRDIDNPLPLLYLNVRSTAIDLVRSRGRRSNRESAVAGESDGVCCFTGGIEERERDKALESAMKTLPLEQREVLTMKIWGNLTFSDISQTLGIPQNTAASRYRYAIARLAEVLPPEMRYDV